mgnify:CR=1 FL=1
MEISGENEIKSGEKISFKISIENNNRKDINEASLIFNIPDVFREKVDLGTIKSGESVERNFETIIFGGRGKNLESRALLEYKPEGSSSFFAEEDFFSFVIAQSPVIVSFVAPEEARSGEEAKIIVKYFSQSDAKISNLFLRVDYPSNFEYKSSNRKPTEKNNFWSIGDLGPGEEASIEILGVLDGAGSEIMSFGALIGLRSGEDFLSLDETIGSLALRLPYLGLDILPKGERENYIASIGEEIPFLIEWKNNLPEIIQNVSLEAYLEGEAFDLTSIKVRDGIFVSKDKKIFWNQSSYKDFVSIYPGGSGFVGFSLKVKKDISLSTIGKNTILRIKASLKPGKSVPGFEEVKVSGDDEIEIPVSSSIQFSQKGLYFESSIPNSGPLPPKVGQETTYTISWSLANPLNDIKNISIKATLPAYADFKEVFVPVSANVSFDKTTGVLEWKVGTLQGGTGFLTPALTLSFKVGIVPSVTHVGSSPQIISGVEVSGVDSFTEKTLSASQNEITTDLRDDPQLDFMQKIVVE